MPAQSLDDLVALLTRLNLVDAGELQHALNQRPPILTADELLDVLERRQLLTRFQTERIRKGETDGLVLGQLKLQSGAAVAISPDPAPPIPANLPRY